MEVAEKRRDGQIPKPLLKDGNGIGATNTPAYLWRFETRRRSIEIEATRRAFFLCRGHNKDGE